MTFRTLLFTLFIVLFSLSASSQGRKSATFGTLSHEVNTIESYPQDPEAAAVVVFEKGKTYASLINNRMLLVTEVHVITKVLDASRFDQGIIEIPYYRGSNTKENISHLKAITHNGKVQTFVKSSEIFDKDITENWSLKSFSFSDIQNGSVLEYTYRRETPFFFNINGWEFQGKLPKIYSEYETELPGNFVYRRALVGTEKLDINKVSLKRDCFHIPGFAQNADCEVSTYAMHHVPAFQEEDYMLSPKNYRSNINYELKEYTDFKGNKSEFTREWKDVDKEIRNNKDIGGQLKYDKLFEKELPQNILSIPNKLDRAKAVYSYIRDYYTWNEKYALFGDARVKDAFEEKSGSIKEINLSLINALEAADLDAKMVLSSTRDNGLPGFLYPVLTDFNYLFVLLEIDGTKYLLDASEKYAPFGLVPFRALNIQGRVMDLKEESSWTPIVPFNKNVHYVNAQFTAGDNGSFEGSVEEISTGYIGLSKRREFANRAVTEIVSEKQKSSVELLLSDYKTEALKEIEEPLKETYNLKLESELVADEVFLYPFLVNPLFTENPFKLNERSYPVDFGYPLTNTYLYQIDLNGKYTIPELPQNQRVKLPQDGGEFIISYVEENGILNIKFDLKLEKERYGAEAYKSLQDFFNRIITVLKNQPLVLKKV